jgi:hypothetical protein
MTPPNRQQSDLLSHKSPRDVLEVVGRYHFITALQVTRLLYKPSYHNYSQKILKQLTDAGYLTNVNWIPKGKSPGWPEFVWSLTGKGRNALKDLGITVGERIQHSPERSQLFMLHSQAVNDTLISAELFARDNPTVFLSGFEHEQTLQRRAIRVPLEKDRPTTVTPDGWTHFTIGKSPGAILWEVDRGTEDRTAWQTKVRAIVALLKGRESLYNKLFGNDPVQVAVVVRSSASYRTRGPEHRVPELLSWTELILGDQRQWAPFFSFTPIDPVEVSPTEFFIGKHWFNPLSTEPKSLIPAERLLP